MTKCNCKPGTEADGWQEVMCESCKEKERQAFSQSIRVGIKLTKSKKRN